MSVLPLSPDGAPASVTPEVVYDSYRLYLKDGRRATVWVAPDEDPETRIHRLLFQHGLNESLIASCSIAGFRSAEQRPDDRLSSF